MSGTTAVSLLSIAQPEIQASSGKRFPRHKLPIAILGDVVAAVALSQHNGDAVRAGDLPRCIAQDRHDLIQGPSRIKATVDPSKRLISLEMIL